MAEKRMEEICCPEGPTHINLIALVAPYIHRPPICPTKNSKFFSLVTFLICVVLLLRCYMSPSSNGPPELLSTDVSPLWCVLHVLVNYLSLNCVHHSNLLQPQPKNLGGWREKSFSSPTPPLLMVSAQGSQHFPSPAPSSLS